MYQKYTVEERCRKILEDYGGVIADKAKRILLKDPILKDLKHPLEFISKSWRDPLTPAMMSLSCEAVGGRRDETHEAALAMSLMNLSFYIWDDTIDKAPFKLFKPTLFGKFGEGPAIIIGGLASAKAFSILNQMDTNKEKHQTIIDLFWNLWAKMSQAETASLKGKDKKRISLKRKIRKIKIEAIDLETCLKIGGIIGNGSEDEIKRLGKYGQSLGIILELWKDFHVSINLTLELAEKIKKGAFPYSLLWASERSERLRKQLENMEGKKTIEPPYVKQIVKETLETRTLDKVLRNIGKLARNAEKELVGLKINNATQTLQLFMEAQPQLFVKSLPH